MAEFAQSDQTGIGASGVVYTIFGYMWVARSRRPEFREVVDDRTVRLLVGCLFLCVPLTLLNWLPVANAAHSGGIPFGMGAAAFFALRYRQPLLSGALLLLFSLPSVTLFWCPWSPSWLSERAYEAHNAGRPKEALRYYAELLEVDPENSWSYNNREKNLRTPRE
ncbi:MAG: rhomboid protease GluP [Planctomycetota bacterium]|jgi:rhomboid protease GluP